MNKQKLSLIFAGLSIFTACAGNNNKKLVLDMVHHNPGEPLYESAYNNPGTIKDMGYNGKVYFLFESPALGITWDSVDPNLLPKGSEDRQWVEKKAKRILEQQQACKDAGVDVYAMGDLILFPKKVIEHFKIQKTFGDINNPTTEKLVRAQVDEVFAQFPLTDGLVVRIGETYLHDAPYHKGSIKSKGSAEKTIIPLMNLLREEICVKRNKKLIFRTWYAFDRNANVYNKVSKAVEPHENLTLSIKHCEGDFHRANPFSKIIGMGRHKQIIEVQCAREYEGKGAYPNYVCHGVIEGFEEHARMPEEQINSIREFTEKKPDMFAGIWTWTRGGGWGGPYIKNELWCDLNAWVMAQWANDVKKSEKEIFMAYAKTKLNLTEEDAIKFRKLCLLSADAVVRGRNSTHRDMNPWWTRDAGIGWPGANSNKDKQARNLAQKDESVKKWQEIVQLSKEIKWADKLTKEHAVSSSLYGLRLYEVYRSLIYLADAEKKKDSDSIKQWIEVYDKAWSDYKKLPEVYPTVSTLYEQNYNRHIRNRADAKVNKLRATLSTEK